jgi:hypothetical protein
MTDNGTMGNAELDDAELDAVTGGSPIAHSIHEFRNSGPSWSSDDQSPKETITFEYGGLQILRLPGRFF